MDRYMTIDQTAEVLGLSVLATRKLIERRYWQRHVDRPVILKSRDREAVVDAGQAAIINMPGAPLLYQRANMLVQIGKGVPTPKWLNRPNDAPVIAEASNPRIMELATP